MKRVVYSHDAAKALGRLPTNMARLIQAKLVLYAESPRSLANNVLKLQGRPGYRLRVGDWRVIFSETETTIDVRAIRPRGSAYD